MATSAGIGRHASARMADELADEADRRAEAVFALLEPGLEPPVQALASSAVVLELLAGDRSDGRVGEVLHHRGQRAGRQAVVGIADHDDRRRGLGEAPVERLGLAETLRAGQRPGPGPLRRRRGLGIPVGHHQDLERARVPVRPEVVDLGGDHARLAVGRHHDGQVGCVSRSRRPGGRRDPAATAPGAPGQPGRIEQVTRSGRRHQPAHQQARPQARPAHCRTSSVTSTPRKRVGAGRREARSPERAVHGRRLPRVQGEVGRRAQRPRCAGSATRPARWRPR